jgi:hypothetical protein
VEEVRRKEAFSPTSWTHVQCPGPHFTRVTDLLELRKREMARMIVSLETVSSKELLSQNVESGKGNLQKQNSILKY